MPQIRTLFHPGSGKRNQCWPGCANHVWILTLNPLMIYLKRTLTFPLLHVMAGRTLAARERGGKPPYELEQVFLGSATSRVSDKDKAEQLSYLTNFDSRSAHNRTRSAALLLAFYWDNRVNSPASQGGSASSSVPFCGQF